MKEFILTELNDFFTKLGKLFEMNAGIDDILNFFSENQKKFKNYGDNLAYASVLSESGGYYRDLSKYDEALKVYDEALEVLEKENLSATPDYGTVLLNKANTLRLKKQFDESLKILDFVDGLFKKTISNEEYRYLALYNTYSLVYSDMNNYKKAIFYMEKTLGSIEKTNNYMSIATTYTNLASLYEQLEEKNDENDKKFEIYFKKAYYIYTDKFKSQVPSFAGLLNTAGIHYQRIKDYEKAQKYFEKSLEIINIYFGKNLSYAITCENLSILYYIRNNIEDYKNVLNEAISIYRKIYGNDSDEEKEIIKKLNKVK